MINSIGMSSTMSMTGTNAMQRQPPPDKDLFKVADADSDGQVSAGEFETLAAAIEEVSGNSIDIDEAMATYDADADGSLSGEELFGLLSSQGFNPAGVAGGGDGGMMPPPPPPSDQAVSAYEQNSGEDTISQLIELLQGDDGADAYSTLEISA